MLVEEGEETLINYQKVKKKQIARFQIKKNHL